MLLVSQLPGTTAAYELSTGNQVVSAELLQLGPNLRIATYCLQTMMCNENPFYTFSVRPEGGPW